MAEGFLDIMLKHRLALEQSFRRTMIDRDDLHGLLVRLGIVNEVFPSGGNFLLTRLGIPPAAARDLALRLLEKHLVYVKDISPKFNNGYAYWRIAVRTPEDHDRLREAILAVTPRRQSGSTTPVSATTPDKNPRPQLEISKAR
jgi:histidinol-phosphate/aromatic aminotransferase/cobyric acid decarboxylase-like protein